ncbi:AraC family transcriptional regulator, transcriptional activator of pobA [Pseudomonas flavescens]|uniref:AraC family transcriptional regulator, transcriptional activator of pobA n=1 Tax=Phytopseudomonas flavescens TaxID=29435 RepID=A0A1G8JSM6_9GAMM|nr:helix-turn-helix domain-containing protein [Pseudomonas flavescens]SDI33560.1 AraC family transcriptional regulator, transcriptional activator of pobA [Pseudomonas flavescens]
MSQQQIAVPVFKLYGDTLEWPTPDLLHCESIAKRSRLHDWVIAPHRHPDLLQLLYLRHGRALIEVEGVQSRIEEAALQVLPPLCVHGFRFSDDVDGYVLTLAAPLVTQLEAHLGARHPVFNAPARYPVGADRPYLDTLFDALDREYEHSAPARNLLLQSLVGMLSVWLGRQLLVRQAADRPLRGERHLVAFNRLVEQHFREQLSVEEYARRLGITTAHLNGMTRRYAGQSAQALIHQRQLLEAKRLLVYSSMTLGQIADALQFSEPAYFSRFFKRLTGLTPSAFRRQR